MCLPASLLHQRRLRAAAPARRRTQRYEGHIWTDKKQVYLGEAAAWGHCKMGASCCCSSKAGGHKGEAAAFIQGEASCTSAKPCAAG